MRRAARALLLLLAGLACGVAPRVAGAEGEDVRISTRLLADEVVLGDDAVVEITVENRTAAAIEIPELRLASDSVSVAVQGEGVRATRVARLYGAFSPDAGGLRFVRTPTRRVSIPAEGSHVGTIRFAAVAPGRLELTTSLVLDTDRTVTATPLALVVATTNTVRRLLVDVETSRQPFTIELDGSQAFNSVSHVWALAREGYYTNLPFHRVVPNLLVQTGDSRRDGTGGPGFYLPAEPAQAPFRRGVVGLARGEHADSSGAQWFVVSTPPGVEVSQAAFDGGFTALGRVVDGMEAVDVLAQVALRRGSDAPVHPDRVERTTLRRK